ncbi:MAG: IS3 family transposase [Gemmatimonadaceae bacterium]|nr:IS3 family transposase [Gemmatimonadaceae bacterium]
MGALLRREGLHAPTVSRWETGRERAEKAALAPKKRGRKSTHDPVAEENERLRKQVEKLQTELLQGGDHYRRPKKTVAAIGAGAADGGRPGSGPEERDAVTAALTHLVPLVGVLVACAALAVNRASYYRWRKPKPSKAPRPRPVRALSDEENAEVLATLDSERFMEKAPRQVYAELLDEEKYVCSVRTMYRVLENHGQVRERRNQRRHPEYVKPELVARAPNQVWSWDITKVPGPERGSYFSLYVILDIFSRYLVGWILARSETKAVAKNLLADAFVRHNIKPGQLVCHSDRGAPMTAKSTALLYVDLGINSSFSRPRVSNDNPYSESFFKTAKYRPEIPERFGSIQHARSTFAALFDWYNERHYHTGIALLTPSDVHFGRSTKIIGARQRVLDAAYQEHPERFGRPPTHPALPEVSWINPPATTLS